MMNETAVIRAKIQQQLEAEKQRITDEILQYPPPIPACDVQFNHLLAQRSGINQEISEFREINQQQLRDFVEKSDFLDNAVLDK